MGTLIAAYISVTTLCIVFVWGHDISVAFLRHGMSRPLCDARGQLLRLSLRQICVQIKVQH